MYDYIERDDCDGFEYFEAFDESLSDTQLIELGFLDYPRS